MFKLINKLFGSANAAPSSAEFTAALQPEQPFYVIGDIHGQIFDLKVLLEKIEAEDPEALIVCVGDYVDRGEHSAQVLEFLQERQLAAPKRLICLMGNHEEMMLEFIDDPDGAGSRWMRYGGLQTMASYAVGMPRGEDVKNVRDRLIESMGEETITWMRRLPEQWRCGNVAVVHAAADPSQPLEFQDRNTLLWGHPEFETVLREDEIWVAHGHVIQDQANVTNGRIAVDTGAYVTGCLTAAHVTQDGVRFLSSN